MTTGFVKECMAPGPSTIEGDRWSLPTRRRFLQASGLGGLVLLGGCTEDVGEELPVNQKWPTSELTPELPVQEQTTVLEERIEALAEESITNEDEFATAFDDYALEVESVEYSQGVLTIEYINTELYAEGNLHDIGPIAGAFAALLDSGFEAIALGITILDAAPASFGSAEIDAEWAQQYNNDELSAKEYGELVKETVESKRHPPEVGISPDE